MRKTLFAFALLGVLIISACSQQGRVKVNGTITGLEGQEVVLLDENGEELSRVQGVGDTFEINDPEVIIGDGRFYSIWVPALGDFKERSANVPLIFFMISSNNTEVEAKIEEGSLNTVTIKGSPMMDEYQMFYDNNEGVEELKKIKVEYDEANKLFNTEEGRTAENYDNLRAIRAKISSANKLQSDIFEQMIPDNSSSIALAAIIQKQFGRSPVEKLEQAVESFDESIRESYPIKLLKERIATIHASAVGSEAPNFVYPDLEGNEVSLADLRGSYVLVDFWASWCGPCRGEMPYIKQVHEMFKDKGLQVVGVSIDTDEAAWRKSIEDEGLSYMHLYDPKNTSGNLYNFTGIPFIVLISPEGIILERNLRGQYMVDKVSNYIN